MGKSAIVILNWNGRNHLEKFLPSVIENTKGEGVRIIIADNGSTDNSIVFLKEKYPQVEIMVFDANYGYTGGYNRALDQIDADYYVLLNSDVEVTAGWLHTILDYMDSHPDVAAAMPKLLAYDNKQEFEYAGAAGGFIDIYGYPFCRGRVLSKVEMDQGQYNDNTEIFWASGACLFVRASAFRSAGKFDEKFFAHMEEIDLCWRLKRMGYKIMVIPSSVVYHVGGGTLPNNNPVKLYLNYRNNLFLLQKNLSRSRLIPIIFVRLVLDGTSALVYLAKFSFGFFWAVFKAHLHFYCNIFATHRKRREFARLVKAEEVGQIYKHSMVFNFIVRKNRTYNELLTRDK